MKYSAIIIALFAALPVYATTWYVDSGASGLHNGTSWANAWTNVTQISGTAAGDTTYISGNSNGLSRTYSVNSWAPSSGTSGNKKVYQIGQDPAHNGKAIFVGSGSSSTWLNPVSHAIISGDAGDGVMHFVCTNYNTAANINATVGLHLSYLDWGTQMGFGDTGTGNTTGDVVTGQGVTQLEMDHIFCTVAGTRPDAFMTCGIDDPSFDNSTIHNCTISVPKQSQSANGADAFQITGSGFSLFSNTISGYIATWTGGTSQHQDGLQTLQGAYVKVYNNVFENLNNTSVFFDGYNGPFVHCYVYNNICQTTSSADNNGPGGLEAGADGQPKAGANIYFSDVIIAYNDMVDQYPYNGTSIAFGNCPTCNNGNPSPYTNCFMAGNIDLNSGGFTTYSSPIVTANNVTLSTSQAQSDFVSYHSLVPTNNYHLLSAATVLIGKGTNFSTYFTIDFDGIHRPATTNWDVGALQYNTNIVMQVTNTPYPFAFAF